MEGISAKLSYLTLLIYPIILIIACVGLSFYKKGEFNEEYFSVNNTKAIQGIAAICIVCHHTAQRTCAKWLESGNIVHGLDPFLRTGFLFNAIFFFCSGYGLYKSYKNKKKYLTGFAKKRMLPVWVPYVIVCFLFTLLRLFYFKERMSIVYAITNLTGITIGYAFGWYVQVIIIFYAIFYFSFKKSSDDFDAISSVLASVIMWVIVGILVDHNDWFLTGEWWYNATLLFPIGLIFASQEKTIISELKKHYKIYFPVSLIAFFVMIRIAIQMEITKGYYGDEMGLKLFKKIIFRIQTYVPEVLSAIIFVLIIVMICMKVGFSNKVLDFLGRHTLEIYLTHAFFLEIFAVMYSWEKESVFYGKPALLLFVTLIGTIISAVILQKLAGAIIKVINGKSSKAA